MNSPTDISGNVFGRLTAIRLANRVGRISVWECVCECGVTKFIRRSHLLSGAIKSCGCYRKDKAQQVFDISGQEFGRWLAISHSGKVGEEHRWLCRCACGTERLVEGRNLRSGASQSCGCLIGETTTARNLTHGLTGTKTYNTWANMIRRCEDATAGGYVRYGGAGVSVCDRWHKFDNFLADMGEAPQGMTIDRRDNSAGYCKDNCRWATATTQARNRAFKATPTGIKGVVFCRNRFRVKIGVGYKQIHIGYFDTLEEAARARQDAENKYWEHIKAEKA